MRFVLHMPLGLDEVLTTRDTLVADALEQAAQRLEQLSMLAGALDWEGGYQVTLNGRSLIATRDYDTLDEALAELRRPVYNLVGNAPVGALLAYADDSVDLSEMLV